MEIFKNDIVEGIIEKQGNSGEGVLRIGNYPVFLDYGLPGEKVRAKVLRANKTHGFGKIIEIEEASPMRIEPPCPYYYDCGGCSLQHQNYEGQLDFKKQRVTECMERIAGIKEPKVEKTIGMANPWNYRNKSQMPLGVNKNGEATVGFYAKRSHRIIDIKECMIQNKESDLVSGIVRGWMNEFKIPVYDPEKESTKSRARSILTRKGFSTNEVMVVLTATDTEIPNLNTMVDKLKAINGMRSIILNINNSKTNTFMGNQNVTLWGEDKIIDTIGDLKFSISPNSFFQVNPVQTEQIYGKVLELAKLTGNETVLDLYCGTGTIALSLAKHAKQVYGVETVPQAIEDAKANATLNNIENATFIEGKSEEVIFDLLNKGIKPDLIVVDPPRKGCDESLLKAIADSGTNNMIYVSCDPATLARDMQILKNYGFIEQTIHPIDNFPQTYHVETVVLITRDNK
ncbi:MAG: 23S rRNA (uracil(1939)-C(5))-methyltransferase RlmD [Clostridiaceae bacterium]